MSNLQVVSLIKNAAKLIKPYHVILIAFLILTFSGKVVLMGWTSIFIFSVSKPLKYRNFLYFGSFQVMMKSKGASDGQPVRNLTILGNFSTYSSEELLYSNVD